MRFSFRMSMILCGVVALGKPQAYVYNIVNQMYHQGGSASGSNYWSMTWTAPAPGEYKNMTYGPYVNYIPSGEAVVMSKIQATPTPGQTLTYSRDVRDANSGSIYSYKEFSTSTFKLFTHCESVNFPGGGANIEMRTQHRGGGNLVQSDVYVLTESQNKDLDFWPGRYTYHNVGYIVPGTDMWEAKVGGTGCNPSCGSQYLTYGPYTSVYQTNYVVIYRLSIDNILPATEKVATLDILYRNASGTVVNVTGRDLYRGDFYGNGKLTNFALEFTNPSSNTNNWEFRVKWHGKGTIRQSRTTIYKVF